MQIISEYIELFYNRQMMNLLGRSQAQIEELYRIGVLGKWKDQQGRRPPGDWDKSSGLIIRR